MPRVTAKVIQICLGLLLLYVGAAGAQTGDGNLGKMLNAAYDFLEAGKIDQAQGLYEQILQRDPRNPLALNNLGAVMAKKGRYDQALNYLKQALAAAKGLKVRAEGVCDVAGLCVALRLADSPFGTEDLEEMIKINIVSVQLESADQKRK